MPVSINQLLNLVVAGAQQTDMPEELMEEQQDTMTDDDQVQEDEGMRAMLVNLENLVTNLRAGKIKDEKAVALEISELTKWIAAHRPIKRSTLFAVHRLKALALEAMNRTPDDRRDWGVIIKATTMTLSLWTPNDGYVDDLAMLLVKAYMKLRYYAHAVHVCSKMRPVSRRRRVMTGSRHVMSPPPMPHQNHHRHNISTRPTIVPTTTTSTPSRFQSAFNTSAFTGSMSPLPSEAPPTTTGPPQFMSPDNIVPDDRIASTTPPTPHIFPSGGSHQREGGRIFFVKDHEFFSKYRKFALRRIPDSKNWKFLMINENLITGLKNGQCSEGFLEVVRTTPRYYFVTDEYLQSPKQLSFPTPLRIHTLGFNQSSPLMYSHALDNLDLQEGQVCLDVGCGCGWFTVIMARAVGRSGKIHGCELKLAIATFCQMCMERYDKAYDSTYTDRCYINQVNCFRLKDVLYDRIHVGCQITHEQLMRLTLILKPTGIIVAPCDGHLTVYRMDRREKEQLFPVMYADAVEPDEDEVWQTWDGRTVGDFKKEEQISQLGKNCMRQTKYSDAIVQVDTEW
eukprot:CAMPEP_0117435572 /NCGR_PEP_ID=MMETSP0759-20121206/552_1 /TAXON_ID=63605 /ORGANISM="Percolomonas cosmopolitus, Strain WS" /LENGTH=565 /DNA_ID=CAMNT_0005227127 /DNA_START=370 /DNA_END=2064 /DNA_ORIENTATION=-